MAQFFLNFMGFSAGKFWVGTLQSDGESWIRQWSDQAKVLIFPHV